MSIQDYVASLQNTAEVKRTRADYWYHLGLACSCVGQHEDALRAINESLKINPQYAVAGITRCFVLGQLRKTAEAFGEFRQFFATSPDDFRVLFPLGVFCMRHGWKDSGINLLERAERLRPNVPYVITHMAAALRELGDERGAQARLDKVKEILDALILDLDASQVPTEVHQLEEWCHWDNPCLAKSHILLSEFLGQRGDVQGAQEELRRGNSLWPGENDLVTSMGRLLALRGRTSEAIRWLSAALFMDPTCHQAHFELSFLHAERGDLEGAFDALKAAMDLRPLFPDYRYQLAILLMDLGKTDEAIEQFERVRAINPTSGHCALHLAGAYLERGDPRRGLAVLANSSLKSVPETIVLAAKAYLMRNCQDEMRNMLERILESDYCHGNLEDIFTNLRAPPLGAV